MKMMKHLAVALMMLLFAQLSFAHDAADQSMTAEQKQQKMEAKIDSKMQETQTMLAIKPDQQAAWDGYKNAVKTRAKTLFDAKAKMKANSEGTAANAPKVKGEPKVYVNTAAERIDQKIAFEETNIKTLKDQKSALDNLYKVLTPEQKKLADQKLKIK